MTKPAVRIAAIDVGTHSIHMLIAAFQPGRARYRVLHREREVVRLGGEEQGGRLLSREAMTRAIVILTKFRRLADSAGAQVRAIATSAVREAENRLEFVRRVEARTGIRLKIASGPEEARLTYLGVLQSLPLRRSKILLLDIGGGSTEFLLARGDRIAYTNSLKMGAVRLSQRFFRHGEVRNGSLEKCREFVEGTLTPVIRDLAGRNFQVAVGTSGTIMNLAAMIRLRRGEEELVKLNGFVFTRRELRQLLEELSSARTLAQRRRVPGVDPRRADVIVGGALILDRVMKAAGLDSIVVSAMALREGILAEEIRRSSRASGGARLGHERLDSVRALTRAFQCDETHARQVCRLSLRLFDELTRAHGLGEAERELLEAAALLHETGLAISHAGHHRHSYYLIRNSDLLGFTENEKEIIANVARYHRKGLPRPRHDGFGSLSEEEQEVVSKLAALLRIADGLDRTHKSTVREVSCRMTPTRLLCRLAGRRRSRLDLEVWGATQKADLFEEVFGRPVVFLAGDARP